MNGFQSKNFHEVRCQRVGGKFLANGSIYRIDGIADFLLFTSKFPPLS